jgi:hypothetical protein
LINTFGGFTMMEMSLDLGLGCLHNLSPNEPTPMPTTGPAQWIFHWKQTPSESIRWKDEHYMLGKVESAILAHIKIIKCFEPETSPRNIDPIVVDKAMSIPTWAASTS